MPTPNLVFGVGIVIKVSFMYHRRYRLTRSRLLTKCLKAGKRLTRTPCFDIIALPKVREPSHPRFCIVVSKKVSNRANKRNLVRRRLREIIRLHLLSLDSAYAYSAIIFILKQPVLDMTYTQLEETARHCFKIVNKTDKY